MQLRVAIALFSSALLALSHETSAATCTDEQKAAANVLGADPTFETACSDVFAQDDSASQSFDPSVFATVNASTLAFLEPCRQASCATYLQTQVTKVPDCELEKVNVRAVFKSIADFCTNNATVPSGSNSTDDSSDGMITVPTTETPSSPSQEKSASTPEKDEATDVNTKADATPAAYAGATAIVAASLLTVLCM